MVLDVVMVETGLGSPRFVWSRTLKEFGWKLATRLAGRSDPHHQLYRLEDPALRRAGDADGLRGSTDGTIARQPKPVSVWSFELFVRESPMCYRRRNFSLAQPLP
jgi:hypothetical protein